MKIIVWEMQFYRLLKNENWPKDNLSSDTQTLMVEVVTALVNV